MNAYESEDKERHHLLEPLIYLVVLTDMCFFYLMRVPVIGNYITLWTKTVVFFVSLLTLFYLFVKDFRLMLHRRISVLAVIVGILVSCAVLETLYTLASYPSVSLVRVLNYMFLYCVPIIALGFIEAFRDDGSIERLMDGICVLCLLYLIVFISVAVVYNLTETLLVPAMATGSASTASTGGEAIHVVERSLGIRLYTLPSLVPIAALYSFVRLFWGSDLGRKRLFYLVVLVASVVAIVFVYQSRVSIIAFSIACAAPLILCKMKQHSLLKKILIAALVIIVVIQTGYASSIVDSFFGASASRYTGSLVNRQYSLVHFFNEFLASPIFGYGFIEGTPGLSYIYHGILGTAYTSDVGFVGQLGQWGLLFAVPYCSIVIRMIYVTSKGWRAMSLESRALAVAYIVYIIATTGTLIMFDGARILGCPVCMATVEYLYEKEAGSSDSQVLAVEGQSAKRVERLA